MYRPGSKFSTLLHTAQRHVVFPFVCSSTRYGRWALHSMQPASGGSGGLSASSGMWSSDLYAVAGCHGVESACARARIFMRIHTVSVAYPHIADNVSRPLLFHLRRASNSRVSGLKADFQPLVESSLPLVDLVWSNYSNLLFQQTLQPSRVRSFYTPVFHEIPSAANIWRMLMRSGWFICNLVTVARP
jgi:hypothetical protein